MTVEMQSQKPHFYLSALHTFQEYGLEEGREER